MGLDARTWLCDKGNGIIQRCWLEVQADLPRFETCRKIRTMVTEIDVSIVSNISFGIESQSMDHFSQWISMDSQSPPYDSSSTV